MRTAVLTSLLSMTTLALADPNVTQILGFLNKFNADFTFPQNVEVTKSINYTGFSKDIIGRLDITGTFVGQELNTEYIFGLFSNLASNATGSTPLIGIPLNATLTGLVIQKNIIRATVLRDFNWNVTTLPAQFDVTFTLNDDGIATQYDIVLFRADALFKTVWTLLIPQLRKELGHHLKHPKHASNTTVLQTRAALDICQQHQTHCLGKNQQYKSMKACLAFVRDTIPFGEVWQGGQNTAWCRYIHTPMLPLRPEVHCPHIGPTGGDMCFEHSYAQLIQNPFKQPFIALPGNLTASSLHN